MSFIKVYARGKAAYLDSIGLNKADQLIFPLGLNPHANYIELLIDIEKKLCGLKFKSMKEGGDFKIFKYAASTGYINFSTVRRLYNIPAGTFITSYKNDTEQHFTIFSYADLYTRPEIPKITSIKIQKKVMRHGK